jgi:hypothetical protein
VEIRTLIEHRWRPACARKAAAPAARPAHPPGGPRERRGRVAGRVAQRHLGQPYHVFFLRIDRTSELDFTWTDERGRSVRGSARIAVA